MMSRRNKAVLMLCLLLIVPALCILYISDAKHNAKSREKRKSESFQVGFSKFFEQFKAEFLALPDSRRDDYGALYAFARRWQPPDPYGLFVSDEDDFAKYKIFKVVYTSASPGPYDADDAAVFAINSAENSLDLFFFQVPTDFIWGKDGFLESFCRVY